jgi:microcin C transport system substrate-binding protein
MIATAALAADAQQFLTLYGDPGKYKAGFDHFDYVNPNAPKGGELHLGSLGSFDSLNGFILKGETADGIGMIYDTLMTSSADEPNTKYPLIADNVQIAADRSYVTFHLNPAAHWQDGTPITSADVVWTFDALRKYGHPFYRSYFKDVAAVHAPDAQSVTFDLANPNNRELPMILAELTVLPKHYWTDGKHDFTQTTLVPPLGSGPYKIASVDAPRKITLVRDPNYWGRDLPVNRGKYNFDKITYDYFRDPAVLLQAFFAGQIDVHEENIAKAWATDYHTAPVKDGRIIRAEIPNQLPAGMQGFVFNIRHDIFKDVRVRRAISLAFDFEWANKNAAFGAYQRSNSYFENSELAAHELPTPDELKLLEPFRNQLPPEVFTKIYAAPKTDGSGDNRDNLRIAKKLLEDAGYKLINGQMVKDGKPLTFELLIVQEAFERWALPWSHNLERIGVKMNVRLIDTAQMQRRQDQFDYDMIVGSFPQSLSPGNEQRNYWQSSRADVQGSHNLIGIRSPVVDALVDKIVAANSRAELITAVHALDRVLLWGDYVVPNWYIGKFRVAYWNTLGRPDITPPYGLPIVETWWSKKLSPLPLGRGSGEAGGEGFQTSVPISQNPSSGANAPPSPLKGEGKP